MHFRRHRNNLSRYLWALLVCFLAVRGLVPAGFMPSALKLGGGPYQLCHGDSRAALLLSNLHASPADDGHHYSHSGGHHDNHSSAADAGHDHDPATAKHFADSTCAFAAATTGNVTGEPADPAAAGTRAHHVFAALRHSHAQPAYFTPPGRAPPVIS